MQNAWCVLAAVLLLSACGGSNEAAPQNGGTPASNGKPVRGDWLVLHLLSDPENLNPVTSSDAAASTVLRWIFPSLLTLDNETLDQRPVIATALPDVSEDKLTYTFQLREDVTYPDGKLLTARDVVFALKAIKNPAVLAPHSRNYLNSVRDASAVDDFTLRIDLKEPYFRNYLVLGGLAPLPRHYYDPDDLLADFTVAELDDFESMPEPKKETARAFAKQFNENYQRAPMGAGAFELRDPEHDIVTGEKIVLKRRKDFWAPDDPVHGDAWVNRIVYSVVNDLEAGLNRFKGGDLDVFGLTPLQHTRSTGSAKFEAQAVKNVRITPTYTYIGWNQMRPLFQDREVRNALRYFIDKQGLIDKVLFGLGLPVESPIYLKRPEYNHDLPEHVFDPAIGKKLLADAGWTDTDGDGLLDKEIDGARTPLRFEIISNSGNPTRKAVGLTVIDEMKQAGIDASFREMDWSIMLAKVKTFDYDAVVLGWRLSVVPPDSYQIWHSSQAVESGSNHVAYKNSAVDAILEEYRTEFDPERRVELYRKFQEVLHHDQPYAFLFLPKAITARDRRFEGVTWYPSGSTDMGEWWVPTERVKYEQ